MSREEAAFLRTLPIPPSGQTGHDHVAIAVALQLEHVPTARAVDLEEIIEAAVEMRG